MGSKISSNFTKKRWALLEWDWSRLVGQHGSRVLQWLLVTDGPGLAAFQHQGEVRGDWWLLLLFSINACFTEVPLGRELQVGSGHKLLWVFSTVTEWPLSVFQDMSPLHFSSHGSSGLVRVSPRCSCCPAVWKEGWGSLDQTCMLPLQWLRPLGLNLGTAVYIVKITCISAEEQLPILPGLQHRVLASSPKCFAQFWISPNIQHMISIQKCQILLWITRRYREKSSPSLTEFCNRYDVYEITPVAVSPVFM